MYNYYEEVEKDILDYVESEKDYLKGKSIDELYDIMFLEDMITGNASGSYTFSTYQAEENIAHNLNLLSQALEEFGVEDIDILEKGAEWCDVTIRCYVLSQVLYELEDKIMKILESGCN